MNFLCRTVLSELQTGHPVVLATLTDQSGSTPRTAGARMLVLPDGSIMGTVGGGLYEAKAIAAARALHEAGAAASVKNAAQLGLFLHINLQGVTDMDMICGGELTLLLEFLPADELRLAQFQKGAKSEAEGGECTFVTRVTPSLALHSEKLDAQWLHVERVLHLPDTKQMPQTATPVPHTVMQAAHALTTTSPRCCVHDGVWHLLEYFPGPHRLFIFGGGHVAKEVADLAHSLGFHCTVLDDRAEFVAAKRFPYAGTLLLPSLQQKDVEAFLGAQGSKSITCGHSGSPVNMGGLRTRDGVIIVTRGHAHDRSVLAAAMGTKAGYIGMIGSRTKKAALYDKLRQTGISEESLNSVHCPIGISIGAQTPREIAVSIAAELIQWRNDAEKQNCFSVPQSPTTCCGRQ